jgi:hypothetical protein
MKTFVAHLLVLLTVVTMAGNGLAETSLTPDDVRERYTLIQRAPCTDDESGAEGTCFLYQAPNEYYLVFVQRGQPTFMRHVVPGMPYQTIWRNTPGTNI